MTDLQGCPASTDSNSTAGTPEDAEAAARYAAQEQRHVDSMSWWARLQGWNPAEAEAMLRTQFREQIYPVLKVYDAPGLPQKLDQSEPEAFGEHYTAYFTFFFAKLVKGVPQPPIVFVDQIWDRHSTPGLTGSPLVSAVREHLRQKWRTNGLIVVHRIERGRDEFQFFGLADDAVGEALDLERMKKLLHPKPPTPTLGPVKVEPKPKQVNPTPESPVGRQVSTGQYL